MRKLRKTVSVLLVLLLLFSVVPLQAFASEVPEPEASPALTEDVTPTPVPDTGEDPEPEPTAEPPTEFGDKALSTETPKPSEEPEATAVPKPTVEPEVSENPEPSEKPESSETPDPTAEPTTEPEASTTPEPTVEPAVNPTAAPTKELSLVPTVEPTVEPTEEPTPTPEPTAEPTPKPVLVPNPYVEHFEVLDGEIGAKYAWAVPGYLDLSQEYTEDHPAWDVPAPEGIPVIAVDDAVVCAVYNWNGIITEGDLNSYGHAVEIMLQDGTLVLYAHLSEINVVEEQKVVRGQQLGRIGSTGNATGDHLHLEIKSADGTPVHNGAFYMPGMSTLEWVQETCQLRTLKAVGLQNAPTTTTFGTIEPELLTRFVGSEVNSTDNTTAYCIEPGTETNYPRWYMQSDVTNFLSSEKADLIGDILSVGYFSDNARYDLDGLWASNPAQIKENASKWAATQVAIWEVCFASSASNWHTAQSNADSLAVLEAASVPSTAKSTYTDIVNQVLNMNQKPSFDGETIELEWDGSQFTKTITDTNGVFSNWSNYSYNGITFTKNGNQLTISTSNTYSTAVTASASYTRSGGSASVIAWESNDDKNTEKDMQGVASLRLNQTTSFGSYIKIRAINPTFDVTLTKTSANVSMTSGNGNYSLSGAKYNVYSTSACTGTPVSTFTTNSSGKATLSTKLRNGMYYVKEVTAPKGYVLDSTVHTVQINSANTTLAVKDDPKKVYLKVVKKDADTNTAAAQGNASLQGAVYRVSYTQNGSTVTKDITTNANGIASLSDVPLGTITVKEITAPTGYKLDTRTHTYTVTADQVTTAVYELEPTDFTETVKKNKISITKYATSGSGARAVESGAQFEIYLKSAGSYAKAKAAERDLITTNSSGVATSKLLPYGTYVIHQTVGANGCYFAADQEVVISQDSSERGSYALTFENAPITSLLRIAKTSEDNIISGLQFKITRDTDNWSKTVTTNANGYVDVSDLQVYKDAAGIKKINYTVTEINTPNRYAQPASQTLTLTPNATTTFSFYNKTSRGELRILKVDHDGVTPLQGAVYELIRKSDGKVLETKTSGKDGRITFTNILYGQYQYREKTAPKGYDLDPKTYDFSVDYDGHIISVTRENTPSIGSLSVKKVDSSGRPMAGVTVVLEYSTDSGKTWKPVTYRASDAKVAIGACTSTGLKNGQLTSGADGRIEFSGLQIDNQTVTILYRLTEVATADGNILMQDVLFEGSLPHVLDGKEITEIEITAVNNRNFELPSTGEKGFVLPMIGAALMLLCSAFTIIYSVKCTERKNEKHENKK